MSSLADISELKGFFSYSRDDDEDARGALSRLRDRILRELGMQLGRGRSDFRLWQDKVAIAHGTKWEEEIRDAIEQSVFFIPIVTPRSLRSKHCKYEFELFLAREAELDRRDLIFPILYVRVPALEDEQQWRSDQLLSVIGSRQYLNWVPLRFLDVDSYETGREIDKFCTNIYRALHRPWESRQPSREEAAAEAKGRQELEAAEGRQEEEADRRAAEEARVRTETRTRAAAEAERLRIAEEKRLESEAIANAAVTARKAEAAAKVEIEGGEELKRAIAQTADQERPGARAAAVAVMASDKRQSGAPAEDAPPAAESAVTHEPNPGGPDAPRTAAVAMKLGASEVAATSTTASWFNFNSPIARRRMAIAAVAVVGCLWAAYLFYSTFRPISAEILWYGVYTVKNGKQIDDPSSPLGKRFVGDAEPPASNSDRIPANQGSYFGLGYALSGPSGPINVRHIYRMPAGSPQSTFENSLLVNVGHATYMGWGGGAIVVGDYTFEVWVGDRKLLDQRFTVYKP